MSAWYDPARAPSDAGSSFGLPAGAARVRALIDEQFAALGRVISEYAGMPAIGTRKARDRWESA